MLPTCLPPFPSFLGAIDETGARNEGYRQIVELLQTLGVEE
jgi:hypothetical protein